MAKVEREREKRRGSEEVRREKSKERETQWLLY